jgi:hypothetical protein
MPFFKSTYNILKKPDEDEVFNPNWMDSNKLVLPPTKPWDYKKEMTIEDVDIWEVLVEQGGGVGIYASWCPYAEFYMVTTGSELSKQWLGYLNGVPYNYNDRSWETYYGAGAQQQVKKRAKELNLPLNITSVWVDETDMWLYQNPEKNKKLIIN